MAEIVRMPKLSDTMEEGVVAEWHKKIGDKVESGELLAEIETDKATMEFESFQDGVLLHIGVEKGKAAPVDGILAILGEEGEDISALLKEGENSIKVEQSETEIKAKEQDLPQPKKEEADVKSETKSSSISEGKSIHLSSSEGRLKASPLARKIASDKGIDLNAIKGSGDGGRIIKKDIDNYQPATQSVVAYSSEESYEEVAVSQMRKTIAKRLGESKFTAPHFYLTIEIDMDNAILARKQINENIEGKVSFNDMVIKAAALSLKKHPKVNSAWLGDKIRYNHHVHVGVAVAVDEGLLVPVIKFADGKPLTAIGTEVREFAGKARDKKLQPSDWEGNTFTISNLGMFGIDEFTAIINPPDSCIMAVGGIKQVAVVKNGAVVPGNTMKVTLSCDHRVVDGALGAAFLQTFKGMMENPVLMLA